MSLRRRPARRYRLHDLGWSEVEIIDDLGCSTADTIVRMEFERMVADEGYTLAFGALDAVKTILHREHAARGDNFGNARLVRNLFERCLTSQANRLVGGTPTRAELCNITRADIEERKQ